MTGTEILAQFVEAGYTLTLEGGGRIALAGPGPPSAELRDLAVKDRDGLKAAVLLSASPPWLARLLTLHKNGTLTWVKRGKDKVEVYPVSVSLDSIAAAVAAEIGMPVLERDRIRPEVEAAARSWGGGGRRKVA